MKSFIKHQTVCIAHEYIGSKMRKCALDSEQIPTVAALGRMRRRAESAEGSGRSLSFVLALHFVKDTTLRQTQSLGDPGSV